MNLAYVNYIMDLDTSFGVYKKICAQKRACKSQGLPVDFFLFYSKGNFHLKEPWITRVPCKLKGFNHVTVINSIYRAVNAYHLVILRALPRLPFYWWVMRRKTFLLITEHHTKLFNEMLAARPRFLNYYIQRLMNRVCISLSDGLIGMTDEIIRYEINHGHKTHGDTITIANGCDVDQISFQGFAPFDGHTLHLIFVSSMLQAWHGLERLLKSLENYSGDVNIVLHLVGALDRHYFDRFHPNKTSLEFHGLLRGKALDEVFKKATIGISTLGLYRNQMNEACSLKTREYAARGLPLVYAYRDPDLSGNEIFCRRLPNDQSLIKIDDLIQFAENVSTNIGYVALEARTHAEKCMDWKPKVKRYYEFATYLYNTRSS